MRTKGITIILLGVGILCLSILFSTGYIPSQKLVGNISRMEIVFKQGEVENFGLYQKTGDGKVSVPLKYPLSVAIVLILLGTGMVTLSKEISKGS